MMKKNLIAAVTALALAGLALPVAFAAEAEWSMDGDCGACHVQEAASCDVEAAVTGEDVDADGNDRVSAGKTVSGGTPAEKESADREPTDGKTSAEGAAPLASAHAALGCAACHSDEEALTQVHDGVTADDRMPKRLRKAKIDPEQLCQSCHGTMEELAQKTTESTALTDGAGTVVNPHDLPDVEDHAKLDCLDCHSMHKGQSSADTAMNTCNGCHHAAVFECGTCH